MPNSGKRGLAYNDASLTQPFSLSGQSSQVSWAYNWGSSPYYPATSGTTFNPALHFIPILWSDASDLTAIWQANVAQARASLRADALLAFNEPDGCDGGQSCMSVSKAVGAYKQWMQPYAGSIALGAPAVSNAQGPGLGLDWLSQFMGNCTGCTVDFVPIHFYGDVLDPGQLTSYVTQAYRMFGKPIWVTEYGTTSGTPEQVMSWLKQVVPWLEAQAWVVRHAYFWDAPGATWLINANWSGMSDLGRYYNSGS